MEYLPCDMMVHTIFLTVTLCGMLALFLGKDIASNHSVLWYHYLHFQLRRYSKSSNIAIIMFPTGRALIYICSFLCTWAENSPNFVFIITPYNLCLLSFPPFLSASLPPKLSLSLLLSHFLPPSLPHSLPLFLAHSLLHSPESPPLSLPRSLSPAPYFCFDCLDCSFSTVVSGVFVERLGRSEDMINVIIALPVFPSPKMKVFRKR